MVQNTGVGPARVRAAAVTVNGQRRDSWEGVIRVLTSDSILAYVFSDPPPGRGRPDERRQWAFIYSVGAGSLTPVETADELVARAARILAN